MVPDFLVPLCPSRSLTSVAAVYCLVATLGFAEKPDSTPAESLCCDRQPSRAWLIQFEREYAMAKRKQSTFERLRLGEKLNRKQRREVEQRLNATDPGLEIVNPDAAGSDVGNESHYVAVPPGRDPQPVREFGSWTAALEEMAQWLIRCRIRSVVMQSTGVYWMAVYDVLQKQGLEVNLVDARGTKNVPGRKTDVQECQWIMKLHTYGLLRSCFLPSPEIHGVRTVWRSRDQHVKDAGRCVQQMQKALIEMNVQLHIALSDISGVSGQAIIRALLLGNAIHEPWQRCAIRAVRPVKKRLSRACKETGRRTFCSPCNKPSTAMTFTASKWPNATTSCSSIWPHYLPGKPEPRPYRPHRPPTRAQNAVRASPASL